MIAATPIVNVTNVSGIFDFSPRHILAELAERFHAESERLGRQAWIIGESDLNDVRVIQPRSAGGLQMDSYQSLLKVFLAERINEERTRKSGDGSSISRKRAG